MDTQGKLKKEKVKQGAEYILVQMVKTFSAPRISTFRADWQTEKSTYVSLIHQIDSGLKRGYRESEIK